MRSFTATTLSTLALALCASAFQVTQPSQNSGWTSTGTNTLAWSRVSTDSTNFTVVLTNLVSLSSYSFVGQKDIVASALLRCLAMPAKPRFHAFSVLGTSSLSKFGSSCREIMQLTYLHSPDRTVQFFRKTTKSS